MFWYVLQRYIKLTRFGVGVTYISNSIHTHCYNLSRGQKAEPCRENKCSYSEVRCRFVTGTVPVTSSLISTSPVFLSRRTKAGMPPQFFRATLFSSLALPYTRFLRAPQALRWTSLILWSSRSTRSWMPPCLRIWGPKKPFQIKNAFSTYIN